MRALKEAHREEDGVLAALSEIETELFAKKYGLVWEEHEEAVDVMMRENIFPSVLSCENKNQKRRKRKEARNPCPSNLNSVLML